MSRFVLALFALTLLIPLRAADTPKPANAVSKVVEKAVADGQVAGAVYLVSQKGKVVFEGTAGHRDLEAKKPMTADTIFRIASMTKPITSVAAMILVDEGKLSLGDPVSKYIPQFKGATVAVERDQEGKKVYDLAKLDRPITIHHLLTHTSGISYRFVGRPYLKVMFNKYEVSDGVSETEGTMEDNVKKLAAVPLFKQPGTAFEYGLNTDVLGRVIEVVSGKTLDAFLAEKLFAPLKMNDTNFIVPADKRSRLATLYGREKDTLEKAGDKPITRGELIYSATFSTRDGSKYFSGGGGLCSTAGDYHRFARMMLNKGELDGKRILKAETVAEMTKNQLGKLTFGPGGMGDSFGYGFGVERRDKAPLPKGSFCWAGLFYTHFWIDPANEVCAVLLTQTFPANGVKLREDFVVAVYKELGR